MTVLDDDTEVKKHRSKSALSLLPLRDVVVYPHMVVGLFQHPVRTAISSFMSAGIGALIGATFCWPREIYQGTGKCHDRG